MSQENEPLPKAYDPADVESRWYAAWEKDGSWTVDADKTLLPKDHPDYKAPYVIVIPPPNVTGSLHMGHAMYVIEDALIRWHRMLGDNALWLPGVDHAGIATQTVVERELKKEGLSRHTLGREKFLERVWAWKKQSGDRITKQLRTLGFSLDWSRERFTMDEGCSNAVTEVFVRLFDEGLMYKSSRLINWCTECRTALSDLEVEAPDNPEKGTLWEIAYPLEDGSGEVIVATTRPETMLGDTAVAVHPDDPRYQKWIGKKLVLPLAPQTRKAVFRNADGSLEYREIGNTIPIIADPILVDMAFGSGAVKVTPGHDFNDYQTGIRHNLPLVNLVNEDGSLNENAGAFKGKRVVDENKKNEARKAVLKELKEKEFLKAEKDHQLSPGRCQRCSTCLLYTSDAADE